MGEHTIFAPATALGRAGVAVIRISGTGAGACLTALSGAVPPPARQAALRRLCDPLSGEFLDQALVLWFPAPASFTGEDVVELHIHGGRAVIEAVTAALAGQAGVRWAEPGEFTRRAFLNDKLDLTEAEALADLVNAETAAQRRQASRQMEGALGGLYESWRNGLIGALAYLEAAIDFPEDDVPDDLLLQVNRKIQTLIGEITQHLDDDRRGERLRDGLHLALVGAPNAGKSTLLNALVQRQAAIVSEVAGTTRDVIETHLDFAGYPLVLADMAGLRTGADEIEVEGVRRARARAAAADLKLMVFDVAARDGDDELVGLIDDNSLAVLNKRDLTDDGGRAAAAALAARLGAPVTPISARAGEGLDGLFSRLKTHLDDRFGRFEGVVLTRARHRSGLTACLDALERAQTAPAPELIAEDLRLAGRELGRIVGRVDVEDVLDVLFHQFCIGK